MMTRRNVFVGMVLILIAVAGFRGFRLSAQDAAGSTSPPLTPPTGPSVQDALHRPFDFLFSKPTRLDEVAKILSKALNAPVALDRAALDRQDVQDDDEVQLDLRQIRLKTGLKLLLDQLDLTYRVEAEDNLLVITDKTGSENPIDLVLEQIKALHKDIHDLQDAVDEVRAGIGLDEDGAKMRKPTIIEEIPAENKDKDQPQGKERPRTKEGPPVATPVKPRAGV